MSQNGVDHVWLDDEGDELNRFPAQWAAWILLLFAAVVWLRSWPAWPELDHGRGFALDFGAYHTQVQRLFADPLRIIPAWVYPPAAAVAFLIFRPFSLEWARAIWIIANLALVFFLIRLCARELRAVGRYASWAVALALVGLSLPVLHCIKWGLTSLAITILVLVALRSRAAWTGALLGLAAGIKIYPLGCLLAPLARREWRTIWMASGASVIFGVLVPVLVFGAAETKFFFSRLLFQLSSARAGNWSSGQSAAWWGGQGLSPALERWFEQGGHVRLHDGGPLLFPLPSAVTTALFFAIAAAILSVTFWALRGTQAKTTRAGVLPLLAVTLLVVPGWHHYYACLPLAVAAVLGDRASTPTAKTLAVASAILVAAPLVLLSDVPLVYFRYSQWGGTTLAGIAVWLGLVLPRRESRMEAPDPV